MSRRCRITAAGPGSAVASDRGVVARRFDAAGVALGGEQAVSAFTVDGPRSDVSARGGGAFVVVWESNVLDLSGTDIFGRRLAIPEEELCGDPDQDAGITATDALFVLRAAVGAETCFSCICDVDDSGRVTALDALMELDVAVGRELTLACASCDH